MTHLKQLQTAGLFDTNAPRYTSYPPANHFGTGIGTARQAEWLAAVPDGAQVSLYLHIPFCKRLCWFCACRTQGTKTMRPVDAYVDTLLIEIDRQRALLPANVSLSRLHLGGGTPTILTPDIMARLLDRVFDRFARGAGFEFSVEIDPTEASTALLDTLIYYGMNRASIGVQDFDPKVQNAIGRQQSFAQTHATVAHLRAANLRSLNMDLLYGLPHQTGPGLTASLEQVMALQPDRLALYGYAHVPWMSKRQVMIDSAALPSPQARFQLAEQAREMLMLDGFVPIGIDHFARPDDGLSIALANGQLRRNFQGYTDDTAEVLIGMGASAISKFPQGYSQNYPSTAQYTSAIGAGDLAADKGHVLTQTDLWVARAIEQLMCRFEINTIDLRAQFPAEACAIARTLSNVAASFPQALNYREGILTLDPMFEPLVRIIAGKLDLFKSEKTAHSAAI